MKIPFYKPLIGEEAINEVVNTLKSGWLTHGPRTEEFEKRFAEYIGCNHAIAVSSGTAALFLSLLVSGVEKGDEVITTPFTFAATANEIVHLGAKPVFVDIEEETFNIDPDRIKEKITDKTKAILPVHYGGNPCNMDEITKIAEENNLAVIEDAAHALGSEYDGRKIGSFRNLTCFSFYATKNLTTGEGGMITTNNEKTAGRLKILRMHGIDKNVFERRGSWNYKVVEAGYKLNTTDINSAIGLAQLKKLDSLNEKRRQIVGLYNEKLANINGIRLSKNGNDSESSWHLYPILLEGFDRNSFIEEMKKRGIELSVHFIPLHLHPFYQKEFGYKKGNFPIVEKIYKKIVSLPLYPSLDDGEVNFVCDSIKDILKC